MYWDSLAYQFTLTSRHRAPSMFSVKNSFHSTARTAGIRSKFEFQCHIPVIHRLESLRASGEAHGDTQAPGDTQASFKAKNESQLDKLLADLSTVKVDDEAEYDEEEEFEDGEWVWWRADESDQTSAESVALPSLTSHAEAAEGPLMGAGERAAHAPSSSGSRDDTSDRDPKPNTGINLKLRATAAADESSGRDSHQPMGSSHLGLSTVPAAPRVERDDMTAEVLDDKQKVPKRRGRPPKARSA